MIQWTPDRLNSLKQDIERARKQRKAVADHYGWTDNLERYVPLPAGRNADGTATYDVNVGADFQDVHRKLAALFYDTPTVSLTPAEPSMPLGPAPPPDPMTGQPSGPPPMSMGTLTHLHQRLLNGYLKKAKAKAKVLKVLFDVLCPAGVGAVKVGYDAVAVPVEQPVLDPMTGQPARNLITGAPITQPVPVPIHEEWYWARISPFAYLVPADHRDTDVSEAPWVAYDFCLPASEVRRRYGLPEEWKPRGAGGNGEDRPYFEDDDLKSAADDRDMEVAGVYLEYHPAQLSEPGDPPFHPKQIYEMVLIDGEEQPILNRPSPHQSIDPQTAQMSPDSIECFTIVPLTLRDRTDQAYVPADCTVTAPLTKELNKYRTVIVQQRDANKIIMLVDPSKINPETRAKIDNGTVGTWAYVEPGALDTGKAMEQVAQLAQGREAWQGQDYIQADRERILGIGANQVGVQSKTNRTATESNNVQRNTEARFEQERQRVLEWYLSVVCLFDAMVLRLMDANMAAKVLGPQAAQAWAANKQHLAGAYAYSTQIDSGKYVDVEAEKQQWMQLLNMVGQSQHVNVVPILKRLASAFGLDPSETVIDQPPQKGPDPPKVNVTLKGDDFNPGLPQFELIIEIAKKGGYEFSMEAVAAAKEKAALQALTAIATPAQTDTPVGEGQPAPGEPPQVTETLPKMPTLNQHQSEESGALPGPGPT